MDLRKLPVQVRRYPRYGWDDDEDVPTDEVEGIDTFSSIRVSPHVEVRAVTFSKKGYAANEFDKEWFVNYVFEKGKRGNARANLMLDWRHKMIRRDALAYAEKAFWLLESSLRDITDGEPDGTTILKRLTPLIEELHKLPEARAGFEGE